MFTTNRKKTRSKVLVCAKGNLSHLYCPARESGNTDAMVQHVKSNPFYFLKLFPSPFCSKPPISFNKHCAQMFDQNIILVFDSERRKKFRT